MFVLAPRPRRLLYVIVFEALAIVLSTGLLTLLSGAPPQDSLAVSVAISGIALVWNYVYNAGFEACERRLHIVRRSLALRALHAICFELGLFLFTVPLYMLWYRVGFVQAFVMEVAILVFFMVYTFLFTLGFDSLFARPPIPPREKAAPTGR